VVTAARVGIAIGIFVGYYCFAKNWLAYPAQRLAERIEPRLNRPRQQVYALVKTVLGVLAQGMLVAALLLAVPQARDGLSLRGLPYLPLGVLLGASESAASIAVCEMLIRAHDRRRRGTGQQISPRVWSDYSRGGWMGLMRTVQLTYPRPTGYAVVCGQVAGEEMMFRQCLPAFIGIGAGGIAISTALFVIMQVTGMKTWQAAAFPVVGALVMGIAHAWVYAAVPLIIPLIVAHACSFLFASRPDY
jgi:hypothetical protein